VQAVLDAIAEPRRREILELLQGGERLVGDLAQRLGLAQPTVSKHLKVMRGVGLVAVRQDAQRRWYRLVPDPLVQIDDWLEPYRRAWAARLDDLERHLDEMEDP
jgi:DNA-binding transcriptional ArsR family regulator